MIRQMGRLPVQFAGKHTLEIEVGYTIVFIYFFLKHGGSPLWATVVVTVTASRLSEAIASPSAIRLAYQGGTDNGIVLLFFVITVGWNLLFVHEIVTLEREGSPDCWASWF